MSKEQITMKGLSTTEAQIRQQEYGKNELIPQVKTNFFIKILHIISEPMFLLLIVAAVTYFLLGEPSDGAIMLIFVIGIIGIETIQEWKTDKTLNALRDLSAPRIKVIRDNKEIVIASADLVPGDIMIVSEGTKIPADGSVLKANDFCVDESSLTGETVGVWKVTEGNGNTNDYWRRDYCYAGTLVTQGNAYILVDKIGQLTEYGKIGKSVASAKENPTPLQAQTNRLVKLCAKIAIILFILVVIITFVNIADHSLKDRIIESILSGVTLAMAMIPEEFPVILTVFLSMGAWRLAKKHSLVRKLPSVETLGTVSVLCVDKTGTITMNQMEVEELKPYNVPTKHLCETMGLACETDTYDPMEKAMLSHCESLQITKKQLFDHKLIMEYPFTNELKMMGHVWQFNNKIVIAAKGSPEHILAICTLTDDEKKQVEDDVLEMSKQGLRVIAVGEMIIKNGSSIPTDILKCELSLCGLVGLVDPPRKNVKQNIAECVKAGIRVIMITGDNGITASSIAKKVGMTNADNIITGTELDNLTDEELHEKVKDVNIFSRVIPNHKMRIVKALQDNGNVVAMTGDGVNDAPALKHADIGIAMGKRGSEVSREASDLILMDDNFSTIVDTIKDGRRIYDNIRKSISYVLIIHIPIAFSSLLAPLLSISPANLMLLPIHIVLLELIIDPTCSIIFERLPMERNIMSRPPRNPKENILTVKTLIKSIVQGLTILGAAFGTYIAMQPNIGDNAITARTMSIVIIMIANLLLVQVNGSDTNLIISNMKHLIKDKIMWLINLGTIGALLLILYSPIHNAFKLAPLSLNNLLIAFGIGVVSVIWYELVKLIRKIKRIEY